LYKFSFDIAFAVVLTQKNDEGNEFPISFMSPRLQGEKLNYPEVEKQSNSISRHLSTLDHTYSNTEPK
jgi:hypothetical protein